MDPFRLDGSVVAVTGAGAGIGAATVAALVRQGASVAALDRDLATAEEVASTVGGHVLPLRCDVSAEADVKDAFARIRDEFGHLDGLHNNAGIHLGGGAGDGPAADVELEVWRRTLDVNTTGQFLCAREALPLMLPTGGGAIVNMASVSGAVLGTLAVGYNASKAAIIGLTRSLVIGYAGQGIRANAICPGPVGTAMTQAVLNTPDVRARLIEGIPAGRMVSVEDLGNLVVFLMSPAGSYVNGAAIPMDGGLSLY